MRAYYVLFHLFSETPPTDVRPDVYRSPEMQFAIKVSLAPHPDLPIGTVLVWFTSLLMVSLLLAVGLASREVEQLVPFLQSGERGHLPSGLSAASTLQRGAPTGAPDNEQSDPVRATCASECAP